MIPARWLFLVALVRRLRSTIVLESAEHNQIVIVSECGTVPGESIDAVSEQRNLKDFIGIRSKHVCIEASRLVGKEFVRRQSCAATRPEEVHARVGRKIRMRRDTQQATFGSEVNSKVQNS